MSRKKKKSPGKKKKKKADPRFNFVLGEKCEKCPALCCKYISLEIDTPEDQEDYENLRWYLIHKDVSVYVIDDEWHLCIDVPCRYLEGNRCGIHDKKPILCRGHDPDECEFNNPDFEMDVEFRSWEDLRKWMIKEDFKKFIRD